jgi:hypothetical protein
MSTLVRVVNQQRLNRSILIDKVDRSSGQFETGISHAQAAKQKVYVPYSNPLDQSVKGYIDMAPTDEVLLSLNGKGTLAQLAAKGYISTTLFNSSLTVAPTISSAANAAGLTTINGTHFLSLAPDITYVTLTNLTGSSQVITDAQIIAAGAPSSISATQIVIADALVTIGTPGVGWKVTVQANSKRTAAFTL